jgi:hypothetical protein
MFIHKLIHKLTDMKKITSVLILMLFVVSGYSQYKKQTRTEKQSEKIDTVILGDGTHISSASYKINLNLK